MRVLILTQYFPPETGAPQNRLYSLAINLTKNGAIVTILTAMPNYPKMEIFKSYKGKIYLKENIGPLTVHRSYILVNKKNKPVARLLIYFSYTISSFLIGWFKIGKQDIIICESPPLFLGFTALFLKWNKRAKLVFNVSDLWPESVEKLGIIRNKLLIKASYKLEKFIYYSSAIVSCQTQGIIERIKLKYPEIETYWLPNGIDFSQFEINVNGNNFRNQIGVSKDDFLILYAGVLGHAQGLETVLEAAEILKENRNIKFLFVGDGPQRLRLIELAQKKRLENTIFLPNKPYNEMPAIISSCDAFIVPLKKLDLFLGAIPSKIFEPLAMGKPIILGVDGEAKKLFIDEGRCGLYYEPENYYELANCVLKLVHDNQLANQLGKNGREYVKLNFDRVKIADEFFKKLVQLIN